MTYANKVAETEPKENQKNPPDAKPDDWRNPWKGAAIGGTLGGLVTTALGYLYGHRGRWLAYDAIAGGGTGAAIGYGVDTHNNSKAEEKVKPGNSLNPYSQNAQAVRDEEEKERWKIRYGKANKEYKTIKAEGGSSFNPFKVGAIRAWKNFKHDQAIRAIGGHKDDIAAAEKAWRNNRKAETAAKWIINPAYWINKGLFGDTETYE